jgi:hypothetical protein
MKAGYCHMTGTDKSVIGKCNRLGREGPYDATEKEKT